MTPQKLHVNTAKAFSLIEVVFAVALFAMASVVLMSSFVNAMLARERSVQNENFEADIRTVRMQLLLEPELEAAEEGDEIETLSNGRASWNATIEPTNVVDLFQVQLNIEFQEPQDEFNASYQEQLYLLRPTWSLAEDRDQLLADKTENLRDARDFD